ncbi:hypothetical protein THARTR1_10214 [Trichoderma harzianum]|uniref:SnoaL-like domain-containing protein n=1 Tax=Trichoderma harzianum TaxID=5544 RepID=A0A2K0TU29_TRIHA|nr:hypothetical protein THARTR1_10214 [Trichoderma harzianum]
MMSLKLLLLSALAAAITSAAATPVRATTTLSAVPTPLHDIPTSLLKSYTGDSVQDVEQIRALLSLYPFAIDGKNFDVFDNIFTSDAVLNYTALSTELGVMRGVPQMKQSMTASVQNMNTLHQYGTQIIDVLSSTTAQAVTYTIANLFTISNPPQASYGYGQFQDHLVKRSGQWWIQTRVLVLNAPVIG